MTSLAVYGIILGGWASNSKYSALGALRASAQVVSYEIPLGMSVVGLALLTGSMSVEKILLQQADAGILGWNIWFQPLACVIFFAAAMAEAQRLPFDLSECEQELVGGWHTEYSAMKWGLFFLGEYTHVITISFLTSILFFGGWQFPLIAEASSNYTLRSHAGQGAGSHDQVVRLHHRDSNAALDNSQVPLRSTDGTRLEGFDSPCDSQCHHRDDCETVPSECVVVAAYVGRIVPGGRFDRDSDVPSIRSENRGHRRTGGPPRTRTLIDLKNYLAEPASVGD